VRLASGISNMRSSAVQKWLEEYCSDSDAVESGIVLTAGASGTGLAAAAEWPEGATPTKELLAAAQAAVEAKRAVVRQLRDVDTSRVVSLPIRSGQRPVGAVAVTLRASSENKASADLHRLVRATATLAPSLAVAATQTPECLQILRFHSVVLSQGTFAAAAGAFVTELAGALRCDRVSVGFLTGAYARVAAISHGAGLEAREALARSLGVAMDEAIEQGAVLTVPAATENVPRITLAHEELARAHRTAICTIPLTDSGNIMGALLLERHADTPFTNEEIALCEHVACMVGPVLQLKRALERSLRERLIGKLRSFLERLRGPGHIRTKVCVHGAVALLALLLFVPVSYRVGAPARLEGSVQRALTAPTDGFLNQAYARPGETVKAGQVLVELAEQDLKIERRRWAAEVAQHDDAYGAALARADRAQLVIAQAKSAEARAQLELIDQQLARTRIVAPFDGIVLEGDLTQSLGAPVQRGETLLKIAPNDKLRLIVEADERDIGRIVAGARGTFAPAALPNARVRFHVDRITPVAFTADGRNYFEVEAVLAAYDASLHPGLRGVAKIDAGKRSTMWIWTHRLVDWLRLRLWAWGA
jgi:biotin carboxyl carrier protein